MISVRWNPIASSSGQTWISWYLRRYSDSFRHSSAGHLFGFRCLDSEILDTCSEANALLCHTFFLHCCWNPDLVSVPHVCVKKLNPHWIMARRKTDTAAHSWNCDEMQLCIKTRCLMSRSFCPCNLPLKRVAISCLVPYRTSMKLDAGFYSSAFQGATGRAAFVCLWKQAC